MSRGAKKFFYGAFYLAIAVFLVLWLSGGLSKELTCFDGKQNQGEEGIDCGGPCALSCEILSMSPLRASYVSIYPLRSGKAVFLSEVTNPNENYRAADVSYVFHVFDSTNHLIETIFGTDSVYPLERRKIFEGRASSRYQEIGKVVLEVSEQTWERSYTELVPKVVVSGAVKTEVGASGARVTGKIKNQGSFSANEVKVIAVLNDAYDIEVFASQNVISFLGGFEEKEFTVVFPPDPALSEEYIDTGRTKVYVYAK